MAKQIYKYQIEPQGVIAVGMPAGAKILSLQVQCDTLCIWALVDPEAEMVIRAFRMYGTGHDMDTPDLPHVGTFQLHGGALVFHLFDAGEPNQ